MGSISNDARALALPPAAMDVDMFEAWLGPDLLKAGLPTSRLQGGELIVVLLGQTGSGKTKFLNLLHNLPVFIAQSSEGFQGATLKSYNDQGIENNLGDDMASKTSDARSYMVTLGRLTLRIIDTPGFADTRGPDQDKMHAKKIVECIQRLGFLNGIAFVINGRDSRMTGQLRYVLSEMGAILPQIAAKNILAVFTNTSSSVHLTFKSKDIDEMLGSRIPPENYILIENPFVLWERCAGQELDMSEEELQEDLRDAFKKADKYLKKFFVALFKMERMNTKAFEELYRLRTNIELSTLEVLNKMQDVEQQKLALKKQKDEVEAAKTDENLHRNFTKSFTGKRWVFKDAAHHGTFCGVKDCHSNCHAPCHMEKSFDKASFKWCCAFQYTYQTVTLTTELEREYLLSYLAEERTCFNLVEDGGGGCEYATVLRAPQNFSFGGHNFLRGAMISVPGHNSFGGWARHEGLMAVQLPCRIRVADESDQDTCKTCGHSRDLHYHDEKMWVEEDYSEETVDEEMKAKFLEARDLRAKKEAVLQGIERRIKSIDLEHADLSKQLLGNILRFEGKGLTRNYALLLRNQRDLLHSYVEATLEEDGAADVPALKTALEDVEKQLETVSATLRRQNAMSKLEWAHMLLNVAAGADDKEIVQKYNAEALRRHPDKLGGDTERMQQINEAKRILLAHYNSFSQRLGRVATKVGEFFSG